MTQFRKPFKETLCQLGLTKCPVKLYRTVDDKPSEYVKSKPPVFHCQVFNGKIRLRSTQEKHMQTKVEGGVA